MDDYENRRLRRRAGAAEEELDASKAKIKQQQHSIEDLYGENAALVAKVKEVRERATIHYQRSEQIRVLAARMMKERDAARARAAELEAIVLAACAMRDAIDHVNVDGNNYIASITEVATFDTARTKIKLAPQQPVRVDAGKGGANESEYYRCSICNRQPRAGGPFVCEGCMAAPR